MPFTKLVEHSRPRLWQRDDEKVNLPYKGT